MAKSAGSTPRHKLTQTLGGICSFLPLALMLLVGASLLVYGGKWYRNACGALTGMSPNRRLYAAVTGKDVIGVRAAIEDGADIDAPCDLLGNSVLSAAVLERNAEMVQIIACRTRNVDHLNNFGASPLFMAVAEQEPELVRILLAAGAVPGVSRVFGKTPYEMACELQNEPIADLLESRVIDDTLLARAIENGALPSALEQRPVPSQPSSPVSADAP